MNFIGQQEVLRFLSQAANSAMEGRNIGGIVALTNPDTITSPAFEVLLEAAGTPQDVLHLRHVLVLPSDGWFGQASNVTALLWVPNEHGFLISGGKSVCVWQRQKATFVCSVSHPLEAEAVGIAYDPDRRTIFVANSVGTLQMFNLGIGGNELKAYPSMSFETAEEKQSTFKLSVVTHRCVGVYYNRKSDYVVAVRSDARLLIHDFSVAKKRLKTFEHNGHIKSMEYDAKNHRLFFGGFNGIISIYDLAGKKLAQITGHDGNSHKGSVFALAYDPLTSVLYSCGYDKMVKTWPVPVVGQEKDVKQDVMQSYTFTQKEKKTLSEAVVAITCMSSQPAKLVVAHGSGIHVFEESFPEEDRNGNIKPLLAKEVLQGHKSGVTALLYVPHERLLISAGSQLKIWANGEPQMAREDSANDLLESQSEDTVLPHPTTLTQILEDDLRASVLRGEIDRNLVLMHLDGAIDINSPDRVTGNTAMHLACHLGDVHTLKILLTEGDADVTLKNEKDGRNAFHLAVSYSETVMKMADIQQRKSNVIDTLSLYLGEKKREGALGRKTMKKLLKDGDRQGKLPLLCAVESRPPKPPPVPTPTTPSTRSATAPPPSPPAPHAPPTTINNDPGLINATPMFPHLLALYDSLFAKERLRAILNIEDDTHSTALHKTVFHEMCDNVELLFKHGADVNVQDQAGFTPLHAAVISGNMCTLRTLTGARGEGLEPAEVNVQDDEGNTPLHYACWKSDEKLVGTLLATGKCYTNIRNKANKVAAELLAEGNEKNKILELLAAHAKLGEEEVLAEIERTAQHKRTERLAAKEERRFSREALQEKQREKRAKQESHGRIEHARLTELLYRIKGYPLSTLTPEQLEEFEETLQSTFQEITELKQKAQASAVGRIVDL